MRTKERHILFFDWFDKYYIQALEEASPEIQKTIIKRMMAKSLKESRSFKDELVCKTTQVQKKKNRGQLDVSINNFDQISKVKTHSDKISEPLVQVEEQQNCIDYPLNLKEIHTDSLLKDDKESEVDRNKD